MEISRGHLLPPCPSPNSMSKGVGIGRNRTFWAERRGPICAKTCLDLFGHPQLVGFPSGENVEVTVNQASAAKKRRGAQTTGRDVILILVRKMHMFFVGFLSGYLEILGCWKWPEGSGFGIP